MTLLLLAGTREARAFATRWQGRPLIASLAGATKDPQPYPCTTRSGGFGGADALAEYLRENRIAAVIDATHPFAVGMSRNASVACATTATPRLTLRRPPWPSGEDWHRFKSLPELAAALPSAARVLLTTGHGELSAFKARSDVQFVARSIEPLDDLPSHITQLTDRPPFALEDETALMRREAITHLVTKNAGGTPPAKLMAAKALGLPICIVDMPPPPDGPVVETVDAALEWARQLPMP